MSFAIILESFKFYKLKFDRTIQLWFVLLYMINILIYILPIGDRDFSPFYNAFDTLLEDISSGSLTTVATLPLTPGNYLILGLSMAVSLVNAFFILLYATLYIGEKEDLRPARVIMNCLAALPRLALLLIPFLAAIPLTACMGFLPVLIVGLMMYFLPLNMSLKRGKIAISIRRSFSATHGRKFFIFIQIVLVSILISLPQRIILSLMSDAMLPAAIITSFFSVLQAFVQGRLMGILYMVIVKKVPLVIPSKPIAR